MDQAFVAIGDGIAMQEAERMDDTQRQGRVIIVMGVSGSGKSTIGARVAASLGIKFIDGDDLHPRANIRRMAEGRALDDEDRWPWLERINDAAHSLESKREAGVIVCSALKRVYRDRIRAGNGPMLFVLLDGPYDVVLARMERRDGHFMKAALLRSQFETLERPDDEPDVRVVDIRGAMDETIAAVEAQVVPFLRDGRND